MIKTPELSTDEKTAAERYQAKGYEVIFHPSRSLLPEQVRSYQPDFIAIHGDQHIAVEVKLRSSLGEDQQIREVADLFRNLPGWRFDLVVIPDQSSPVADSQLLSRESCQTRLKSADVLATDSVDIEAAILLLWTTIEAALRAGIGEPDNSRGITGARLAKEAFSLGWITKKEWEVLDRLARVRNQVVHGEKSTRITKTTYKNARSIASRLIQQIPLL